MVDFHQAYPSGVIFPAHDRRVIARRNSKEHGRFQIIGWSETGVENCGFLRISPVIVGRDQRAILRREFPGPDPPAR